MRKRDILLNIVIGTVIGVTACVMSVSERKDNKGIQPNHVIHDYVIETEVTVEPEPEPEPETVAKVEKSEQIIVEESPVEPELIDMGTYFLTAYCPCYKCCGKTDGITASGTVATQGRTVAVDPKIIPYGTTVVIDGKEYIAEDTGGAIRTNHIDVFFNSHEDALVFGEQYKEVFIKKEVD